MDLCQNFGKHLPYKVRIRKICLEPDSMFLIYLILPRIILLSEFDMILQVALWIEMWLVQTLTMCVH